MADVKSTRQSGRWTDQESKILHAQINRLVGEGFSDLEVARQVGCSSRTVIRHRESRDIANFYERMSL